MTAGSRRFESRGTARRTTSEQLTAASDPSLRATASVTGPLPAGGKNPATIRLGRGPVGSGSRNRPAGSPSPGVLKPCSKSPRKRRGSAGLISPVHLIRKPGDC